MISYPRSSVLNDKAMQGIEDDATLLSVSMDCSEDRRPPKCLHSTASDVSGHVSPGVMETGSGLVGSQTYLCCKEWPSRLRDSITNYYVLLVVLVSSGLGILGIFATGSSTQGKMKGQGSTKRMKSRPRSSQHATLEASERLEMGQ